VADAEAFESMSDSRIGGNDKHFETGIWYEIFQKCFLVETGKSRAPRRQGMVK
jgi:hypothetical protein